MTDYVLRDSPLSAISFASRHINLVIKGGTLSSEGTIEYSPKVANIDVRTATIDTVEVIYLHQRQTQNAETRRIEPVGKTVEKEWPAPQLTRSYK